MTATRLDLENAANLGHLARAMNRIANALEAKASGVKVAQLDRIGTILEEWATSGDPSYRDGQYLTRIAEVLRGSDEGD